MHARFVRSGGTDSDWTHSKEYDVLGWVLTGSGVEAVVVDDNGVVNHALQGNGFDLVEVYATSKVI